MMPGSGGHLPVANTLQVVFSPFHLQGEGPGDTQKVTKAQ